IIIKTLITKSQFVPSVAILLTKEDSIDVSPFILYIQCKLCSDVTGILCTEALLAGLGAFWDGESGWSCSPAPDAALEDLSDRPHDVAQDTVQMFFLNHKSSNVIHVFS